VSAVATPVEQTGEQTEKPNMFHAFCGFCWPVSVDGNVALCGTVRPASSVEVYVKPDNCCLVCEDMLRLPCEVCGR
jgi:hypothetical protein